MIKLQSMHYELTSAENYAWSMTSCMQVAQTVMEKIWREVDSEITSAVLGSALAESRTRFPVFTIPKV
jgi:hypothetical protein